ncbi:hypothetical protein M569_09611, partial [Genlisea aurea]
NGAATMFEPQVSGIDKKTSSTIDSSPELRPAVKAPEKKLTLFALRVAVLEKAATRIGTLGFIWATVVLLGGFAITLERTDFWFVTVILVIEGARIFGRSHELEWQHQATWSIADVGISSFRAVKLSSRFLIKKVKSFFRRRRSTGRKISETAAGEGTGNGKREEKRIRRNRTWRSSEIPMFPLLKWIFLSRNISRFLYWLQLASAVTCVGLSMLKLIHRNYGATNAGDPNGKNRNAALIIFYSLALADAVLFLTEKAYWEWMVSVERLVEKVNGECELGDSGLVSTRRFFYDSYSKCINGSIFDGLKMDMVSFSMELLDSNSSDEQLIGARILRKFAGNPKFSDDTLQKIGTNLQVIGRLLEMLNWKEADEEEIRYSAAETLANLAGKVQNSLRIAEITGAMESISSLLHGATDRISEKRIIIDDGNYSPWSFNQLGLQILKKLARDRAICGKIGNTRGLLPKIIDFMHTEEKLLWQPTAAPSQIVTVKRSLQLLKLLTSTSGEAGKFLRRAISEIVFTVSYIRDILKNGDDRPDLQFLGIEILTNLAIDDEATEMIGRTGGVLKVLFIIFFNDSIPENRNKVRTAAGEALSMLSLHSNTICNLILNLKQNDKLIGALKNPLLNVNAARIIRHLCSYAGNDDSIPRLHSLTAAAPTILEAIMKEESKLQEVMIGAASSLFKFMDHHQATDSFRRASVGKRGLIRRLVGVLQKYRLPSTAVPGIRRYAIELSIWMMRNDETSIRYFEGFGMTVEMLESVLETTSELEGFNIFSGPVGVYRHRIEMHSLVEAAVGLLQPEEK